MDGKMNKLEHQKKRLIHGYRMLFHKKYPNDPRPTEHDFEQIYWDLVESAPLCTDEELERMTLAKLDLLHIRPIIMAQNPAR